MEKDNKYYQSFLLNKLEISPFKERFPWIGGDLQTLRDTLVSEKLPIETAEEIKIPVKGMPVSAHSEGHLLALLDRPKKDNKILGLVLILHGLGGSSRRNGLRRMTLELLESGFSVLRVNLRGADPGRYLAAGTYSAKCNSDLIPVINYSRRICKSLANENSQIKHLNKNSIPLFGVGISLGGTILLNACMDEENISSVNTSVLDGLACISSPLDLSMCSASIERPRNFIYQFWLLKRLVRQTLEDPFGISQEEKNSLMSLRKENRKTISSIREFDSLITSKRWGYKDVDDYYKGASPFDALMKKRNILPQTLIVQSKDDPWVPSESFEKLKEEIEKIKEENKIEFILTEKGGHNGFHGENGCWGDLLVKRWLLSQIN